MNKMWNVLRIALITLLVLTIAFILFVVGFIWYKFYDITGLTLYNDEPISEIIPFDDRFYFITEDGEGYVAGGYAHSSSRIYLNSQSYENEKLGIPSPVKFSDEKIEKLYAYSDRALFITESKDLYRAFDEKSEYICSDIIYADHATWRADTVIYAIDTSNTLYSISEQGEKVFLCDNVKIVKAYRERIFVLRTNGVFCELIKTEAGSYEFSNPIFENVAAFDVMDTSTRFDGVKFIFDDEKAINTPLFNVLTENGDLYVKGVYNLLCCTRASSEFPEPFELEEWTLISDNVNSFDLAPMGTIFIKNDTSCAYYGFDVDIRPDEGFEVKHRELFSEGAVSAYTADDVFVIVKTSENKYFIWSGMFNVFTRTSDEYDSLDDAPFVLEP